MKKVNPWIIVVIASLCLFSCKSYIKINDTHETKMGTHDVTIKPGDSASSSSSMTSGSNTEYTFDCGGTSIVIENEELSVNGVNYGALKPNDTILIEDGVVSVAGVVRKSIPIPAPVKKPTTPEPEVTKPDPAKYRTASAVPGKEGFVFNPWTNKQVDVRGIESGQLVRDPEDNDPTHKFRIP